MNMITPTVVSIEARKLQAQSLRTQNDRIVMGLVYDHYLDLLHVLESKGFIEIEEITSSIINIDHFAAIIKVL